MTIEKKVREIIYKAINNFLAGNDEASNQATQAILALMKPMSRERLIKLTAGYKCGYPFVHRNNGNHIGDENAEGIADAILAEWRKD